LIDTESELAKVSWPGSEELTRSTTAVLISIVLLGGFLFCVDWLVALVMRMLEVLPG
jgi:preprotein translocase SecE subunit